jgi:ribonuclease BN (tRNA processing enzyme)
MLELVVVGNQGPYAGTACDGRSGDNYAPGHLSPAQAGAIALRAGVDRLILTHIHPEVRVEDVEVAASREMGSKMEVACCDRRYSLKSFR